VLASSLLCIGVLVVFILSRHMVPAPNHAPFENISDILPFALSVQAFPVSFVAWLLAMFGVGRDLGERSGSYLFTRPEGTRVFCLV
jgi:predicted MFS family arabinose efflux permease